MALIEIDEPSPSALRWFGLPFAVFFLVLGTVLWWRGVALETVYAITAGASLVVVVYYAVPSLRRLIYLGWLYAAYPFGFVIAHVVMLMIYALVITPLGLLSRLMGRRAITRGLDPRAPSHWQARTKRDDPGSYFKQY